MYKYIIQHIKGLSMYLSAKQVKDKYQITSQTLHNWRQGGNIKFIKTPSGKFLYSPLEEQPKLKKQNVIYARVSNTKQKDDLIRQKQTLRSFVTSNGLVVDAEYEDIASGMNEQRKSFNVLIEKCISGEVDTIFVTFKDRLTRFGYGYIENMLKLHGVKIIVINATSEEDFQTELTQDLISIIHHFSMKMYSNRRKQLKDIANEIAKDINT